MVTYPGSDREPLALLDFNIPRAGWGEAQTDAGVDELLTVERRHREQRRESAEGNKRESVPVDHGSLLEWTSDRRSSHLNRKLYSPGTTGYNPIPTRELTLSDDRRRRRQ